MYRDTWSSRTSRSTARLAWAQSTASLARRGDTRYAPSSSAWACSGVSPWARARVGSFTGRTPVSIPQGGAAPVTCWVIRKKQRTTARRRWPSRSNSVPERDSPKL